MCDTLVLRRGPLTLFAKNSDREPSEEQCLEYVPRVRASNDTLLQTSYLNIAQVPNRYACVLSRPLWMWGAEMGVNECGLVIGNEAVFSRKVKRSGEALLGMDLLRLALERSANARQAIECIASLLAQYGQGGPAGYRNKDFRYDSSFLIADPQERWIMETAGDDWVAKPAGDEAAISNAYVSGTDYTMHSEGLSAGANVSSVPDTKAKLHFAKAFDTRLMRFAGHAATRRRSNQQTLASIESDTPGFGDMIAALRQHHAGQVAPARGSNRDVCMHAASALRPSQTCASMIVKLVQGERPVVMVTGTSAPCLSLFQSFGFPESHADFPNGFGHKGELSHWQRFESIHRRALTDNAFRMQLLSDRDDVERKILRFAEQGAHEQTQILAQAWMAQWFSRALDRPWTLSAWRPYGRFWRRLNRLDGIQ